MSHNVDLFRALILRLERMQLSPRSVVLVSTVDEADELGVAPADVKAALNALRELDYIEGPGDNADGLWLFRKLTRKGVYFVERAADPLAWAKLKIEHSKRQ